MVTWIPSIYPLFVSIYTSTMDPMAIENGDFPYVKVYQRVSFLWNIDTIQ